MQKSNLFLAGFLFLLVSLLSVFPVKAVSINITLKGPDTLTIEMGYPYSEPGYTAVNSNGVNYTSRVIVASNSPSYLHLTGPELIPGTYKISYNVRDSSGAVAPTLYRYVVVLKDTMRPKLVVLGPDTTFIPVNKSSTGFVTLPKILSSDDLVDGTMPDTITPQNIPINKVDTALVVYSTGDMSGNHTKVYRWVIVYDSVPPKITLNPASDTAYFGAVYKESATFTDNYYSTSSLKITRNGTYYKRFPTGMPDTFGTYTIIYTVQDPSGNVSTATLSVMVKDTFKPSVALVGKAIDTMQVFQTFADPGVTATDKYYTSAKINVTKSGTFYANFPSGKITATGIYYIIYTATNPSGMHGFATRTIVVTDTLKPVISLSGSARDSVQVTKVYNDPGVKVSDPYYPAGRLTTSKTGTFYTAFPNGAPTVLGTYDITYTVQNPSGGKAFVSRIVKVIDSVAPVISLKGSLADSVCSKTDYIDAGYDLSDIYYSSTQIRIDTVSSYNPQRDFASGTYYVQYKATNPSNRSSLSGKRTVFVRPANSVECKNSISENASLDRFIRVYPNPNTGQFSIHADLDGYRKPVYISISDLLGHTVAVINSGSLMQTTFTVDLTGKPAGVYLLNVTCGSAHMTKQVVIVR